MIARSLMVDGGFSLEYYRTLLATERSWRLLGNSLELALLPALLCPPARRLVGYRGSAHQARGSPGGAAGVPVGVGGIRRADVPALQRVFGGEFHAVLRVLQLWRGDRRSRPAGATDVRSVERRVAC